MQTSLVGDLIIGLRETATDPCKSLPPPVLTAFTSSGGGSVTFYCLITQLTPWGESAPSNEMSLAGQLVSNSLTVQGTCSFSATAIKIYITMAGAGQEDRYFLNPIFPASVGAFTVAFSLSSTLVNGFPPQRSSAWLPDTDGTALSASSIYRWINEGLDAAASITEGIRDITGIPSTNGQAQYQLIGNWRKLSSPFYDGYPVAAGNKFDVFRHSGVVGLTGTEVMNQDSQIQYVELWPQPNRTAGNGTLLGIGSISATATTLNFTPGANGFVLSFGLALIGTYPADLSQCEIVYYSGFGTGSQLVQVQRGQAGTVPQSWAIGTAVTELNIFYSGIRYPLHYTQGQAAQILNLPPAWIDAVRVYLESRFKKAEQDVDNAAKLLQEFNAKCQNIKGNRTVFGPRQIQAGSRSGVEIAAGFGTSFGGVILP